jgi:hypothetical protein
MSRLIFCLMLLAGCSSEDVHLDKQLAGKRVFVAKGNISFTLPDTTLIKGKSILWPSDTRDGSYGEAACFYHSLDSTTMLSVYVTAMPASIYYPALPWRVYADEKQAKYVLAQMTQHMALIEHFVADSSTRTVEIDYHLPKRPEVGRRGVPSYAISLTFHGRYRRIKCHFLAPDNTHSRQMLAAIRNSLMVNPNYLAATAKRYPEMEYQD